MSEYSFYPEKPILEKVKVESNWGLTAFTVVLFIGTFLLIFSDQLEFVLLLILVLFIHEMGHYASMKKFGYENVRMLFIPLMGAFVQGIKDRYSQKQSFIVAAAGPFPGLILGSVGIIFADLYRIDWLMMLSFLFIFLNTINLLPLDPLDGGQLFKLMVNKKRDLFLMIFALLSSLVLIIGGFFIDSWILIGFGFFMGIRVRNIQRNHHLRKQMEEEEVNYISTYEDLSNRDYAVIRRIVIEQTPALKKYIEMNEGIEEEIIASHVNGVLLAPVEMDASKFFKISILFLWIALIALPFLILLYADLDLQWYFEGL
jgi:stage IV sporulation protein FB